jgi:hypothetical protein
MGSSEQNIVVVLCFWTCREHLWLDMLAITLTSWNQTLSHILHPPLTLRGCVVYDSIRWLVKIKSNMAKVALIKPIREESDDDHETQIEWDPRII